MRNDLIENDVLFLTARSLKLLLNEARTVLVTTELYDVSEDILPKQKDQRYDQSDRTSAPPSAPICVSCLYESPLEEGFSREPILLPYVQSELPARIYENREGTTQTL
jgi:hypothetical protein